MDSTRPIRALVRGLDALTMLNTRDGATVSEVARQIRLPRTTAYRILETLCRAGYVFRDSSDERYRLTIRVRALSEGFDDEAWVAQIAKPLIEELGRELAWPVSLATLLDGSMIERQSTSSALAIERHAAGQRSPLLSSAMGRVYLSFCPPLQRETLIDALARSAKEEDRLARAPRTDLQRILAEIKLQGFAAVSRTRRLAEEVSVSVPVTAGERLLACLTVCFSASAMPLKLALERFVPKLKQCASGISKSFVELQVEPQRNGAPERAA